LSFRLRYQKNGLLTIIFLVLFQTAYSQNPTRTIIAGIVLDEGKEPLVGTLISLHPAEDTEEILGFTTTDGDGKWRLEIEIDKEYVLEFRFLGYKSLFVAVNSESKFEIYQSLILQPDAKLLEEIEIQAEKMAKVNGDTISYNLKAYTNGTEENLGDILKKLPGLKIEEDGSVKYNGKRVQLLLNGKDILNGQHKLATEGLNASDIAEVRVLNNYRNFREFLSQQETDAVGLEIILTDAAKAKWKGNASVAGGYENTAYADVNFFNINDKLSATVFGRFNNTGESIIGLMDYLGLQPSLKRTLQENADNLNEIIPKEFSFPQSLTQNRDGLIAVNLDYSEKENFQVKFSLMGIHFDRLSEEGFERNYWVGNSIYKGNKTEKSSLPMLNSTLSLILKNGKKSYLELELPYSYRDSYNKLNILGLFDSIPTSSRNAYSETISEFAPKLYFSHKISEKLVLLGNTSFERKSENSSMKIEDVEDLFGTDLQQVEQIYEEKSSKLYTEIGLEYAVKNHLLGLMPRVSKSTNRIATRGNQEINKLNRQAEFEERNLQAEFFYQFKNEKWTIKPTFTLFSVERKEVDGRKQERQFYSFEGSARYAFLPLKNLTFKLRYQQKPFSFQDSYNISLLRDARSLEIGSIPILELAENTSLNLSYVNFNQITGAKVITSISFSHSDNSKNTLVLDSGSFVVYETETIPKQRTINLNHNFSKKLESINIIPNINFSLSNTEAIQNNGLKVVNNSQQISLGAKSIWKGSWINAELKIIYRRQEYDNGLEAINKFSNLIPNFNLIFNPKKIRIEAYSKFTQNYSNGKSSTSFLDIGFGSNFAIFKNQNLKITFKGKDLLNLDGAKSESVNYGNTFLETNSFRRFAGYLLVGLRVRI
jgi:hypothetical protein